jgi:hypothetical protein
MWNLGVLDFPALKYIRAFTVVSLDSVHTFNLPSLEHAANFWFSGILELHTFHAPKLTELRWLQLRGVPPLTTPPSFFATRFKGTVGTIDISLLISPLSTSRSGKVSRGGSSWILVRTDKHQPSCFRVSEGMHDE